MSSIHLLLGLPLPHEPDVALTIIYLSNTGGFKGGRWGRPPPLLALAISHKLPFLIIIQPVHLPSLFAYKDGKCHV